MTIRYPYCVALLCLSFATVLGGCHASPTAAAINGKFVLVGGPAPGLVPLSGRVVAVRAGDGRFTATVGRDGRFHLTLPFGSYRLVGYRPHAGGCTEMFESSKSVTSVRLTRYRPTASVDVACQGL